MDQTQTGVARWAAATFLGGLEVPPMLFVLLVALMTMGLSEMVSNVAAVATVLPLAYNWGAVLGVNPVLTTLVTALAGGLAFMFPMGTPPNAIAYSSGYYSIADSVRAGVLLSLMALGVFLLVALTYWPLAGIR
ncbi:SLC13 family permease [Limnochorda pilosa]